MNITRHPSMCAGVYININHGPVVAAYIKLILSAYACSSNVLLALFGWFVCDAVLLLFFSFFHFTLFCVYISLLRSPFLLMSADDGVAVFSVVVVVGAVDVHSFDTLSHPLTDFQREGVVLPLPAENRV